MNWSEEHEEIEEKIVEYCLEERRVKGELFAAVDCYFRLREHPDELVKITSHADSEKILDKILSDTLDEFVEICRDQRGWSRYACADMVLTYIKNKYEKYRKYTGNKVDVAVQALQKMLSFKK